MITQTTLRNIQKNLNLVSETSAKSSSQSKIQQPSDDPTVAAKAVVYRNYVSTIKQYQDNVDAADSWMTSSNSALTTLSDAMSTAKELSSEAATSSLTSSNKSEIAEQVTQLKSTILDALNTQYGDSYVFGGYATDTAPYTEQTVTISDGTNSADVDVICYKGKIISMDSSSASSSTASEVNNLMNEYVAGTATIKDSKGNTVSFYQDTGTDENIQYNTGYGSDVSVNVEGQDVIGTGASNLFNILNKVTAIMNDSSVENVAESNSTPDYTTAEGESFDIDLDGTKTTITVKDENGDGSVDATDLQTSIDTAVGSGKVTVSTNSSNHLVFSAATGSGVLSVSIASPSSGTSAVSALGGFDATSGSVNYSTLSYDSSSNLVRGSSTPDYTAATGKSFSLTVSGTTKTITVADENGDSTIDATDLQTAIDNAFGTDKVTVSTNTSGALVFTGESGNSVHIKSPTTGTSALQDLGGLADAPTVKTETNITQDSMQDVVSSGQEGITNAQAKLGARQSYVEMIQTKLDTDYTNYKTMMTSNEKVDLDVAYTDYTTAQTNYSASLTVAAKAITNTLVDYLK